MDQEITGEMVKNFRIEQLIGSGSTGNVYKVFDLNRNVYLAMKVLHEDLIQDSIYVKLFKEEGRIHEQLKHDHIVKFYGFFQIVERYFTLQDFIKGTNLYEIIRKRKGAPFRIEEIIYFIDPICRALSYAHSKDIIHCDVKPGNILINQNKSVFLTDFGISSVGIQYHSNLVGFGSPAYMAPEQISREFGVLSPQTDVYALGVILYLMVSGILPFNGTKAPSANRTLDAKTRQNLIKWEHCNIDPIPLHRINPEIPSELDYLITQCLRKDPMERIQNPSFLLKSLNNINNLITANKIQSNTPITSDYDNKKARTNFFNLTHTWYYFIGGIVIALSVFLLIMKIYYSIPEKISHQKSNKPSIEFLETTASVYSPIITQTKTLISTNTIFNNLATETENKYLNIMSCMEKNFDPSNLARECITGIQIENDGKLLIEFTWQAFVQGTLKVTIHPDNSNKMYITDNFNQIHHYISKGDAANQEFTLTNQQIANGWFLFPPISDQVEYIIFHDDDNSIKTDPIYLK